MSRGADQLLLFPDDYDDEGLSARIEADHLGHSRVSETQDTYMARGRVHPQVAQLMERTMSDE